MSSSNDVYAVAENALRVSGIRAFYARNERAILGTATVVGFLVIWELAVSGLDAASSPFFSSPSRMWKAAVGLIESGELWTHIKVSGGEFLLGYLLSAAIGVPLGICLGWYRRLNYAFEPFTSALYAAPGVAFLPLIMIWLGIGLASKIALIVLAAVFPILINSRDAVKTTPRNLLEAANSFQASQWQIFKTVVLPSAVPFILTGLRLGAGRALIGVFVAEMYIAQAGVGYMITQAGVSFKTDIVLVGVLIFSAAGMITLELLSQLERRFDKWRPAVGSAE
jgi:ABC-type nitrate/sulfonate/bicarbonate transport system permease component